MKKHINSNLLSKNWTTFLWISLVVGVFLRVLFVQDMEYKEDEEYNFTQTQLIGITQPWPWYGIPSGVYLVNPGMSIWVFTALAKLFDIHTPTGLAHAVQLFALLGMSLVVPFALRWVAREEQKIWLWSFALAMVNPFLVLYQRKLWPEPFLPFFTMLTLIGWWNRDRKWAAILWGFIGAWLGQIHMSGFFFSAGLFVWTLFFDRKPKVDPKRTHWTGWFIGSVLGALPLIPWFIYLIQHPVGNKISAGWNEIIQLKYWTFWLTNPTGLHLGNPLGILRGNSHWAQISDFIRYPVIAGQATYLNGLAHAIALIATVWILARGIRSLYQNRKKLPAFVIGQSSDTTFVQNSAFIACGILMTATGIMIRRYYMNVTFPLEFIFLIQMAKPETRIGKNLLICLWITQLFMSANFVGYIHVNQGATQGDYGQAYHLIHPQK
jgi:hypothetical protein